VNNKSDFLEIALKSQGLSALISEFQNQGIDDGVLRDLEDKDLIDLGVTKLGDRKRLLKTFKDGKIDGEDYHIRKQNPLSNPIVQTEVDLDSMISAVTSLADQAYKSESLFYDDLMKEWDTLYPTKITFPDPGWEEESNQNERLFKDWIVFNKKFENAGLPARWPEEIRETAFKALKEVMGNVSTETGIVFNIDETINGGGEKAHKTAVYEAWDYYTIFDQIESLIWNSSSDVRVKSLLYLWYNFLMRMRGGRREAYTWVCAYFKIAGFGCAKDFDEGVNLLESIADYYDKYAFALSDYYAKGKLYDALGIFSSEDLKNHAAFMESAQFPTNSEKSMYWRNRYFELISDSLLDDAKTTNQKAYDSGTMLEEWPTDNPVTSFIQGLGPLAKSLIDFVVSKANTGNPQMQWLVGKIFQYGIVVQRDSKTAVSWFQKSADVGDAESQYEMGESLRLCNPEKATEWYKKATSQSLPKAWNKLGFMFGYGLKTTDKKQSAQCYVKAAELGDSWGITYLGEAFRDGDGVVKDPSRALELFNTAAKQNNTRAFFNLYCMYNEGDGVPKDPKNAIEWLLKAGRSGDDTSMITIAMNLENGSQGFPVDQTSAISWYQAILKTNSSFKANAEEALKRLGA
jgi:TPR repeat protein